jgi:formylglycine-generating enzyme required for sulfatase activity
MNDENDTPKNQPQDDWAMSEPSLKIPQNQPPSSDFDTTAPAAAPPEEKQDKWEMPTPVFRVSSGTPAIPAAPKNQPETASVPTPDFSLDEDLPQAAAALPSQISNQSAAPQTQRKSSRLPFIAGGLFIMFFLAAGFLVGIYYLFLNKPEMAQIVKKPENSASNSNVSLSSPVSATPDLPKEIEYKALMLLVPAGEFIMGSDTGEDVSKPAHKVTIPAFYIDKYEVTNAQFKEFCDATQRLYPKNQYWNENYFQNRPNAPVVGVSFDDAKAYAAWAGKRLPTEEEWEKAASWDELTQTKREFPWGNEFAAENVAFNLPEPADVGKYLSGASASGALDMSGNVLEWVDAFFKRYPNSTAESAEFGEKNRVVRGGYFGSKGNDRLKTTKRIYVPPAFVAEGETASYIGFRCAISADDARLKSNSK